MTNVPKINIPESHQDLLTAPVAVLATQGADGFPQVSAVWFLYDNDGALRLSLNTTRQKVKNMQKRPEVTLFILDPANPYRTIEIRARAEEENAYDVATCRSILRARQRRPTPRAFQLLQLTLARL